MITNPSYSTEPEFIDPKDALKAAQGGVEKEYLLLEKWIAWAREHITAQRMKIGRLESELTNTRNLLDEHKKEKAELQEALAGIQALNRLRKSVEVLELGSKVNVVGEDITGTLESVILNKGNTVYVVKYWHGGEQRTAYLSPECVTPADMLLPTGNLVLTGKDYSDGKLFG